MKKSTKKVNEDAVMAAGEGGAAPSGLAAPSSTSNADTDVVDGNGTSTEDVLGKFDPNKGFLAKDNFFKPKNILGKGKVMKRNELPYGNKKKKNLKNDYVKGMKILGEAAFNRQMLLAVHEVPEYTISQYILKKYNIRGNVETIAIAYFPTMLTFFLKFMIDGNRMQYVQMDFRNRKFVPVDNKIYFSDEVMLMFDDLNGIRGWVIWGGL